MLGEGPLLVRYKEVLEGVKEAAHGRILGSGGVGGANPSAGAVIFLSGHEGALASFLTGERGLEERVSVFWEGGVE